MLFYPQPLFFQKINAVILNSILKLSCEIFMQPPFPTKKFFLVLLFIVFAAGGIFKLFSFLNRPAAPNTIGDQKLAVLQNEVIPREVNLAGAPTEPTRIATSTLNAVAAVVYLNEQTKANGATMEEIATKVASQIQDAGARLDSDMYSKNDILTASGNSPEALKKYGNDMAGIFIKYGDEKHRPYLEIIKRALETNDPKKMAELDPYITFQKNVVRHGLALSVPSTAATTHLRIINASAEMAAILQGFQSAFSDVPAAVASNSRLTKASKRFAESFKEADAFFKQNGVVFLPEEDGHIFASFSK